MKYYGYNLEELAWKVCGASDEEIKQKTNDEAGINKELKGKFNVDIFAFQSLVDYLIKFTTPNKSPLAGENRRGEK